MRIISLFLSLSLLFANLLHGFDLPLSSSMSATIDINNKVLLKVNGKSISIFDIVKKLDLLFYKQFPEHLSSPMIRYQFYVTNWRIIFAALVDEALILADAEEKKIEVTEGDVREELENLFGPDVVLNIDKLNLSYDEAFELLKRELIVQRMLGIMVRSKAISEVHPKDLRALYKQKCQEFPAEDQLVYQVLSIRSADTEKRKSVAKLALQLLREQKIPFSELLAQLPSDDEQLQLSLSEEVERKVGELSLAYKAVLETLAAGQYSSPQTQSASSSSNPVCRIFFLKEKKQPKMASFSEMEKELQQQLLQEVMGRYQDLYLSKLREQSGITKELLDKIAPKEFEPFTLR